MKHTIKTEEMIKLYLEGCSTIELARKYNSSQGTISNRLRKENITIRKYSNKNSRKRAIDLNFFKSIDSHNKAYLLGLLVSDGSVDNTGLGFQFTSKDIELISDFKEILQSEHKICEVNSYDDRTKKTYMRYTIHICSKDIVDDLRILGVENNKSFDCPMPNIDDKYFWSFLRGLFDGDGSVTDYGDGRVRIKFIFSSPIMNYIKNKLTEEGLSDNKVQSISTDENGFEVQSIKYNSFKDVKFLNDKMYENSEYKLHRKYQILKGLKEHTRGCYLALKNKVWKKVEVRDLENNLIKVYDNINECCEELDTNKNSVYRVLSGKRNHTNGYKFKYV